MKISEVLERETIIPDLQSRTKPDVIRELADNLAAAHPGINNEKLIEVLMEREKLCSTAVDCGVAIPHAKMTGTSDIIAGFGRSFEGIDYDSLDAELTHLFIILVAPETSIGAHIQLLARISKIFRNPDLRAKLMTLETKDEIYDSIIMEDAKL
ncbi:MAG TPA: PTS sugar transporter subunit IIA [Thermodesulfobacteriota bacterium]|nr:PTS sugar transporter subunit IIA [Thermodesulfobacteriota bacterium]